MPSEISTHFYNWAPWYKTAVPLLTCLTCAVFAYGSHKGHDHKKSVYVYFSCSHWGERRNSSYVYSPSLGVLHTWLSTKVSQEPLFTWTWDRRRLFRACVYRRRAGRLTVTERLWLFFSVALGAHRDTRTHTHAHESRSASSVLACLVPVLILREGI